MRASATGEQIAQSYYMSVFIFLNIFQQPCTLIILKKGLALFSYISNEAFKSEYVVYAYLSILIGGTCVRLTLFCFVWPLTGAVLYGVGPGYGGGSIEGTREAVGAAMFRLVVISGTRVTGNQAGAGEMSG